MFVYIVNADKSMYVSEVNGVVSISWVAAKNMEHALKFPAASAEDWVKIITDMIGVQCSSTTPQRPGML